MPLHLPSASPAIVDDAILKPPLVAAPQHQAVPDAQLDAHSRFQRRQIPPPYLDDYVVSPFQRAYNVECAKLFDSQSSISDVFHSMRSNSPHLFDVHPLNNQITSSPSSQTKILTTILQSDSFMYLMIRFLVRYHNTLIVRRQILKTILNLRLHLIDGFVPFAVTRDADVDYRAKVERNKAACREQVLRRKSTPLAITFATCRINWTPSTAPVTPCAASSAKR